MTGEAAQFVQKHTFAVAAKLIWFASTYISMTRLSKLSLPISVGIYEIRAVLPRHYAYPVVA